MSNEEFVEKMNKFIDNLFNMRAKINVLSAELINYISNCGHAKYTAHNGEDKNGYYETCLENAKNVEKLYDDLTCIYDEITYDNGKLDTQTMVLFDKYKEYLEKYSS